jgi:hypothetical protein
MASKIEFITINERYPEPGQDNDSQGFRDNFAAIKKSLGTANQEITDLQNNAVRKDTISSSLENNTLERLNLKSFTQQVATGEDGSARQTVPSQSSPQEGEPGSAPEGIDLIDFDAGQYQSFTVTGDVDFSFINWPEENYGSIIVELTADTNGPYTVTFSSDGGGLIKKDPNVLWDDALNQGEEYSATRLKAEIGLPSEEYVLIDDSTTDLLSQVFEFWTYNWAEDDPGTVYVKYLGGFNNTSEATSGAGTSDVQFLNDLDDVDAPYGSVQDGQTIVWDPTAGPLDDDTGQPVGRWIPGEASGGGGAEEITIASASADFTVDTDDINTYIRVTSFGTVDVNVPTTTLENIPVGSSVSFFQNGVGTVQIVPDPAVTVNSSSGFLTTRDQYSAMTLTKIGENEWDLIGDIAAFVFVCGISWLALNEDQYADKAISIGEQAPTDDVRTLFALDGSQMLHLVDPYDNPVDGSFVFITNSDGELEASFGTADPVHDLLFWVADGSDPLNYFTTGTDFESDEAVIYFRPNFDSSTIPEAVYTFNLVYRDPNAYASFGPKPTASSVSLTVTAEDYDANPDKVYAIPFPSPGAFNGISVAAGNLGGAILDFRLCKDFAQQKWPFNTQIPIGTIPDDPIIETETDLDNTPDIIVDEPDQGGGPE